MEDLGQITMTADSEKIKHNKSYTIEHANIATSSNIKEGAISPSLLAYKETGNFFELLANQSYSLGVSREYEHFVLFLDGNPDNTPWQSGFPLPHPSGFCVDPDTSDIIFSSTRTPNILMWFSRFESTEAKMEILAKNLTQPNQPLFLPKQARYLPGSLYIHDLVKGPKTDLYATITGHNFLAKLDMENGWERVWWPKVVEQRESNAFNQNYLQLNSIALNETPEKSFYTAFSNLATGAKPWKEGYGPREKGVIYSGETREPLLTKLTCPHSARLYDGKLWLCNSGYGSVGYIDNYQSHDPEKTKYVEVFRAPGFTRGLAFAGNYGFVGLSKVIDKYEAYAPGVKPTTSECGVICFDIHTGVIVATLSWENGYQIYDVQILPDMKKPKLPLSYDQDLGFNELLRFFG